MKFSALAGNGMQRVSSDAAAVLFFLKKRKKRMGAQRKQATNGRPYVLNRSTIEFAGERFPPGLAASDTKRVEIFFDL